MFWGQLAVLSGFLFFNFIFIFHTVYSWTLNSPPVSSGPSLFTFKELIQILFARFHNDRTNSAEHLIRRENSWSWISILNRVIESLHCSKSAALRRRCSQRRLDINITNKTRDKKKIARRDFFSPLDLMLKITLIIECIMVRPWELRLSSEWRPMAHLLLTSLWEAVMSIMIYISIRWSAPLLSEP